VSDVLIVGGGIVGCAVVAECARQGLRVTLFERGTIASGASDLDLALIPADVDASRYLELHHFTGGGFFLDRSLPDEWPARRIDPRAAAAALAAEARSYRASVQTGCDAKTLIVRRDAVRGVLTDDGEVSGDVVVVASGADGARLCAMAGIPFPLAVGEGTLAVGHEDGGYGDTPVVAGDAWAARDPAGRLVVAEPGDLPELSSPESLVGRTLRYAAGMGRDAGIDGLVVAGGGRWGVADAPAVGSAIAERISST
jgi:glycine/D-amino acid oxidase-like deaminating enzyme